MIMKVVVENISAEKNFFQSLHGFLLEKNIGVAKGAKRAMPPEFSVKLQNSIKKNKSINFFTLLLMH